MAQTGELRGTISNFLPQEVSGIEIPSRPVWLN